MCVCVCVVNRPSEGKGKTWDFSYKSKAAKLVNSDSKIKGLFLNLLVLHLLSKCIHSW